ncbi:MAG: amino acid permease [Porticoccaceae bacterium]|jgi:APA family basic amino acid/polyamine antiporter|tara:strand:+ start:131 stop:1414 length:1284 start_codon:yes stop_codon:yes gene_type:complete
MSTTTKKMGFWQCWGMSVGVMIGSGIFLLPTVLAPYGWISLLGWLLTCSGTIVLSLVLARLAGTTDHAGGPYAYVKESFGDLAGFLIGWGYWVGVVFGVTAIAVGFAGYMGSVFPIFAANSLTQALVAAAGIGVLTWVNVKGVSEAATVQLVMTILKIIPLIVIIGLGIIYGDIDNFPAFNPQGLPVTEALASTALLTMWAFIGIEAAVIATDDVESPKKTIPIAVVSAAITVSCLYVGASIAIMFLVPSDVLALSESPFVDAASHMGTGGALLIGIGALISTAGALNGNIFVMGQMAMAVAADGLAPAVIAKKNRGGAPAGVLIVSSVFSTALLVLNFTEGLVGAFSFLISMSTLSILAPYGLSAVAEFKRSWLSAKGWAGVALLSVIYTLIAAAGSGWHVFFLGLGLFLLGIPLYKLFHPDIQKL